MHSGSNKLVWACQHLWSTNTSMWTFSNLRNKYKQCFIHRSPYKHQMRNTYWKDSEMTVVLFILTTLWESSTNLKGFYTDLVQSRKEQTGNPLNGPELFPGRPKLFPERVSLNLDSWLGFLVCIISGFCKVIAPSYIFWQSTFHFSKIEVLYPFLKHS